MATISDYADLLSQFRNEGYWLIRSHEHDYGGNIWAAFVKDGMQYICQLRYPVIKHRRNGKEYCDSFFDLRICPSQRVLIPVDLMGYES